MRPGVSGMAQARLAELLAHAWSNTGDPRFAEAGRQALAALTVGVDDGGAMSRVTEPGGGASSPWYVERAYPGASPWKGAALNGFMVTLLSLRSAADTLSDRPDDGAAQAAALARGLAERGAETLRRFLPLLDSGTWSYYGLLTPGHAWRTDLADLNYHCYHVALLERLAALWPGDGFADVAARWAGDVARVGATCPAR